MDSALFVFIMGGNTGENVHLGRRLLAIKDMFAMSCYITHT